MTLSLLQVYFTLPRPLLFSSPPFPKQFNHHNKISRVMSFVIYSSVNMVTSHIVVFRFQKIMQISRNSTIVLAVTPDLYWSRHWSRHWLSTFFVFDISIFLSWQLVPISTSKTSYRFKRSLYFIPNSGCIALNREVECLGNVKKDL